MLIIVHVLVYIEIKKLKCGMFKTTKKAIVIVMSLSHQVSRIC